MGMGGSLLWLWFSSYVCLYNTSFPVLMNEETSLYPLYLQTNTYQLRKKERKKEKNGSEMESMFLLMR